MINLRKPLSATLVGAMLLMPMGAVLGEETVISVEEAVNDGEIVLDEAVVQYLDDAVIAELALGKKAKNSHGFKYEGDMNGTLVWSNGKDNPPLNIVRRSDDAVAEGAFPAESSVFGAIVIEEMATKEFLHVYPGKDAEGNDVEESFAIKITDLSSNEVDLVPLTRNDYYEMASDFLMGIRTIDELVNEARDKQKEREPITETTISGKVGQGSRGSLVKVAASEPFYRSVARR